MTTEQELHEAQISSTEKFVEILCDQFNGKFPIFLVATPGSLHPLKINRFFFRYKIGHWSEGVYSVES